MRVTRAAGHTHHRACWQATHSPTHPNLQTPLPSPAPRSHYACMLANPAGYNSTGEVLFTGGDGRPQPTYQPMRCVCFWAGTGWMP